MVKIYNPASGSALSHTSYLEFSLEEAKAIIEKVLKANRIVIETLTRQRILDAKDIKEDSIIRIFPLVGGG